MSGKGKRRKKRHEAPYPFARCKRRACNKLLPKVMDGLYCTPECMEIEETERMLARTPGSAVGFYGAFNSVIQGINADFQKADPALSAISKTFPKLEQWFPR